MRAPRSTILALTALTAWALPALAASDEASEPATGTADSRTEDAGPHPTSKGPSPGEAMPSKSLPQDAGAALIRATAAYDYGDMNQMVEAARPVAEGLLPATPEQQAQAFRLLGIGLYLTNRPLGAETAFTELLRKDPKARLDPTTTRPELVAFFESLRHQHLARQRSTRKVFWNFIPPVGQFQNEDNVKGWIVLSVGVVSLGTATTSAILLNKWERPGHIFPGHENTAGPLRAANWVACGVLAAVYIYGVFDGLIGYSKPIDESQSTASLRFRAGPGGLGFTF
jgi:hypothetical protein